MQEIELIFTEIDRRTLEAKVKSLGAKVEFDGVLEDTIFESDFFLPDGTKRSMRIRRQGDRSILTCKVKIKSKQAKIRKEMELEISDPDTMAEILLNSGFSLLRKAGKKRTQYLFEDVRYVFDKYLGELSIVPEFMEIEAGDLETLYEKVRLIGLDPEKGHNKGALKIYKHLLEEAGIRV